MNSQTSTKKRNQKEQEKRGQKVAVRLLSELVEHLRPAVLFDREVRLNELVLVKAK